MKNKPILNKLISGDAINLLDYTGNLRHQVAYDASWDLFKEKDPVIQTQKADAILASIRAMGQEDWALLLQNSYFPRFGIRYTVNE